MDGILMEQRRVWLKSLLAAGAGAMLPGCAALGALAPSEEEQTYQLGCLAYMYGFPLVYFARMRYTRMMVGDPLTGRRARWGEWQHRNRTVTPEIPGAPQTDTLYSTAWLELGTEPYILQTPALPERYWSVQCCDLFGTTFAMLNRRNSRAGGAVALVGPDWNGQLPPGVARVYRARMRQAFLVMRIYFSSESDMRSASAVQPRFALAPLSAYLAGRPWQGVAAAHWKPPAPASEPLADFKTMQLMWQDCPPPADDEPLLRRLASLGLAPGVVDGFAGLSPAARRGLERAEADSRKALLKLTHNFPGVRTANGWIRPRASIGTYADKDYHYRASVALIGTVATPVDENVYYVGQQDAEGVAYNGDRRYELYFAPGQLPDCDAFWSLHAYRYQGYTVIPNPIQRYAISARAAGLRFDDDGGLRVYVQADDPGGANSANWLPVMRGTGFFLVTRGYEPKGSLRDLSWQGPLVKRLA